MACIVGFGSVHHRNVSTLNFRPKLKHMKPLGQFPGLIIEQKPRQVYNHTQICQNNS